jgi:hypothetical protein
VPGQRTTTGTTHPFVDVAVEHTVEGIRAGRSQAAANHREQHHGERRDAAGRQKHGWHRGHEQKLDDARLGQAQVGSNNIAHPGELTAAANRLHPEVDADCALAYVNLVGGHPIWHVDARHKLYSLTISGLRSMRLSLWVDTAINTS